MNLSQNIYIQRYPTIEIFNHFFFPYNKIITTVLPSTAFERFNVSCRPTAGTF